jgi:hypothetical protein
VVARCQTPGKNQPNDDQSTQTGFTIEQRGGQNHVETMLSNGQTGYLYEPSHGCGGAFQQGGYGDGGFEWAVDKLLYIDIAKPIPH